MKLTDDQIRDLAEVERKMDAGEMPFVMYHGQRAAMSPEAMEHFDLKQGQSITDTIWGGILRFDLASIQDQIATKTVLDWMDRSGHGTKEGEGQP